MKEYIRLGLGMEVTWLRQTAGRWQMSRFIRLILGAAETLDFGRADWEAIQREPGRFRDVIQRELDKIDHAKRDPEK